LLFKRVKKIQKEKGERENERERRKKEGRVYFDKMASYCFIETVKI
jgi:hypothetical protein